MNILIAPALGVLGLIAAFVVFSLVMRYSDGTDQVKKIGDEIHKGAMKFMKTEYTYLLIFVAVLVVLVAAPDGRRTGELRTSERFDRDHWHVGRCGSRSRSCAGSRWC